MKLSRYASDKNNPAVKGNLTVEEIVRADWERNYKKKNVPLDAIRMAVKTHVDSGGAVFRLRNTLFLVTPVGDFIEVEFHTITADPIEVYLPLTMMFFLGLNKDQGTEVAFTYVDDKSAARMAKRIFSDKFVDMEDSDEPDEGKYRLTIDLIGFVQFTQAKAQAQAQARPQVRGV